MEWLTAAGVLLLGLLALPLLLRSTRPTERKGGGAGMLIAIGLIFAMVFDPKAAAAIENVTRKKEIGESEEGDSDDEP